MSTKLKAALFMSPFLVGVVALCIIEPPFLLFIGTMVIQAIVVGLFVLGIILLNND